MARTAERSGHALGIFAMLASTILFPLSDLAARSLVASLPGLEVAWMRYAILIVLLAPMILRRPHLVCTACPRLQVSRGLCSVAATTLALSAFGFLPVADATAIGFVTPILVLGLAMLVLREPVGRLRWLGACAGFCGVMVIVRPGTGTFQAASLLPLISSVFSAGTVITTRLAQRERVQTTIFWSTITGLAVLSALVLPIWRMPTLAQVELGTVMGALAALATMFQIVAYRSAPSSLVAPFSYAQLLWAGGFEWLLSGHVPGPAMVAGSAIIFASSLFVTWRETRVIVERAAPTMLLLPATGQAAA